MDAPEPATPGGDLEQLPIVVRRQVLALVARVLPDVPDLPGPLRSVASFTPGKRARLGGHAIASALLDVDFRHRAGTQAAPLVSPDAADVDRAAVLWLTQEDPAGLATHLDRVAEAAREDPHGEQELHRLRAAVSAVRQEVHDLKASHREEVAALKDQNKVLRQRLGASRSAERAAGDRADRLQERVAAAEQQRDRSVSGAEAEGRRLRSQVEELTAQLERLRSAERSERGEGTVRARILLDTLVDAAAGLRRELALPPADGAPAARVEEELAVRTGTRTPTGAGALGADSPALLAQLLALPRARLVVDGYNVSKAAWESSSLEAQRARLLQALAPLVARTRVETTVVFDAAAVEHRPLVSAPRGVKVLFSPYGVIADDVIREIVAAEPAGRAVVVVSSDREVAEAVRRAGFRCVGAGALVGLLARH